MSFSTDPLCSHCPKQTVCGTVANKIFCYGQVPIEQYIPTPMYIKIAVVVVVMMAATALVLSIYKAVTYIRGRFFGSEAPAFHLFGATKGAAEPTTNPNSNQNPLHHQSTPKMLEYT